MSKQIQITGFTFDSQDGRYWSNDETLGIVVNDDGSLTLLDEDGYPSGNTLSADHAEHILSRARRDGDDAGQTMRRWDNYASSL